MSRQASVEARVYILEKALEALEARVEGLLSNHVTDIKMTAKASQKKPQEVVKDGNE